jgi:membrane-associated protease RseP (regulator of RpoE activity)
MSNLNPEGWRLSTIGTATADATEQLRRAAAQFMQIDDTTVGATDAYRVRFRGRLLMDSMQAYDQATRLFRELGYTPLFRKEGEAHVVLAVAGTINPKPSQAWVNWLLFGLTVMSVLLTGAFYTTAELPTTPLGWVSFVLQGWPFLVSMLGILLAHELGHYFAARYHKVAVTLPYFIPLPPPIGFFGTLGAFIQLKSPPTNRRVLLDIGLAGPLAGLVVAIPVLLIGLMTSPVTPIPAVISGGIQIEGNSILYVVSKYLVFGRLLPEPASFGGLHPLLYMLRFYLLGVPPPLGGTDVILNQVAWAGWAGLLVTGLNLIPAGQLDGGHALYVLVGRRARAFVPVIIVILLALGLVWPGWFLWAALIYFMGRAHAEPLDQITELDGGRRLLAILGLILFFLVITPVPLTVYFGN